LRSNQKNGRKNEDLLHHEKGISKKEMHLGKALVWEGKDQIASKVFRHVISRFRDVSLSPKKKKKKKARRGTYKKTRTKSCLSGG